MTDHDLYAMAEAHLRTIRDLERDLAADPVEARPIYRGRCIWKQRRNAALRAQYGTEQLS